MLSYQHAYHAGNPADCIKHTLWGEILAHMTQANPAALWVAETHAGRGQYPINGVEMDKLKEYAQGVTYLWPQRQDIKTTYMKAVKALNSGDKLAVVPGSPAVAMAALRPQDTLHLCEAHPLENSFLTANTKGQANVHVHKADGHRHIPGLLKGGTRAAILIDPSYEVKSEYAQTVSTVAALLKRAPQATVMVWAPVLPDARQEELAVGLQALNVGATWQATYIWAPGADQGLIGSMQIVCNLPYQMEKTLPQVLYGTLAPLRNPQVASRLDMGFLVPRR